MASLIKVSFVETMQAVAEFLAAEHQDQVLDSNLCVVKKKGVRWCLLCLLSPFYRFFGSDAYSHVRIYRLADKIFDLCKIHESELKERPILCQMIKVEIMDRLNTRTKKKYNDQLSEISQRIGRFLPQLPPDSYLRALCWPKDLSTIGIQEKERVAFRDGLTSCFRIVRSDPFRYKLGFEKNGLKGSRVRELYVIDKWQWSKFPLKVVERHQVPLPLYVMYQSHFVAKIVLLTKQKLGEGGQVKVHLTYDLITGERAARKNCLDPIQKFVAEYICGRPPLRGIVPVLGFRKISNLAIQNIKKECQLSRGIVSALGLREVSNLAIQNIKKKCQLLEALYKGTLSELLQKDNQLVKLSNRLRIIEDLLHGLSSLHEIEHEGLAYRDESQSYLFDCCERTGKFKISHSDLKPSNILIKEENGKLGAVITDFGSSNPLISTRSLGFQSPEMVRFYLKNFLDPDKPLLLGESGFLNIVGSGKGQKAVRYKIQNGRQSDIWAMGLVISMVLVGRTSRIIPGICPLKCIEEGILFMETRIHSETFTQTLIEVRIADLSQKSLDRSIQDLKDEHLSQYNDYYAPHIKKLWILVEGMLKVNPLERLSAREALSKFSTETSRELFD